MALHQDGALGAARTPSQRLIGPRTGRSRAWLVALSGAPASRSAWRCSATGVCAVAF